MQQNSRESTKLALLTRYLVPSSATLDGVVKQDHLLTALEEDVDGTQNRLAAAQRKLNNVLEKMGMRGQFCLVVFLLVILALLMFVAFH